MRLLSDEADLLSNQIGEVAKRFSGTERLPILIFQNEEDFREFSDESKLWKTVEIHQVLAQVTKEKLEEHGVKVSVVEFEREPYLKWLKSKGKTQIMSTAPDRAMFAAIQASDA